MEIIIRDNEKEVDKKFEMNGKEEFLQVASELYDIAKTNINDEEYVKWDDLLKGTIFVDPKEFKDWLHKVAETPIMSYSFDYDEFKERCADEYVEDNYCGEYRTVDDLINKVDRMESAMSDIKYIADDYC